MGSEKQKDCRLNERALLLLRAIQAGYVKVEVDNHNHQGSLVKYSCPWASIFVFDDAGAWDYIDSIFFPDGKKLDFDEMILAVRHFPGDMHIWGWSPAYANEQECPPECECRR